MFGKCFFSKQQNIGERKERICHTLPCQTPQIRVCLFAELQGIRQATVNKTVICKGPCFSIFLILWGINDDLNHYHIQNAKKGYYQPLINHRSGDIFKNVQTNRWRYFNFRGTHLHNPNRSAAFERLKMARCSNLGSQFFMDHEEIAKNSEPSICHSAKNEISGWPFFPIFCFLWAL